MIAATGPTSVITWDAVAFAGSAVLFAYGSDTGRPSSAQPSFVRQLCEGWDDFRSRPWLVAVTVQAALVVPVWMVGFQLLGPVYGQRVLGGAGAWGLVTSAFTAGLVARDRVMRQGGLGQPQPIRRARGRKATDADSQRTVRAAAPAWHARPRARGVFPPDTGR